MQQGLHIENAILDDCNMDCNCPTKTWDPVCGSNGLSYMSACLAGCETFVGTGLNMVTKPVGFLFFLTEILIYELHWHFPTVN